MAEIAVAFGIGVLSGVIANVIYDRWFRRK